MKNTKKTKSLLASITFFFLIASQSVLAQGMQIWTWDTYSTKFAVPSDFQEIESNGEKFSAGNSAMNLTIYPRLDEHLSYEGMVTALNTWAIQSKVQNMTDIDYVDDLNGYWGVFVEGTYNGNLVVLLLAIDPDYPDTSLYIWLSYPEVYESVAEKIIFSFTPN